MPLKEKLLEIGFIDNYYLNCYIKLIESNRETKREKFKTQRHHIIPKCISKIIDYKDVNLDCNIVNLTHRNHLYAHWLLYNMTSNENYKYRLGNAILEMIDKKGSRNFDTLTKEDVDNIIINYDEIMTFVNLEISKRMKNRIVSKESKKKLSEYWKNYYKNGGISHHKGKKHSQETKDKISLGNKGKVRTKEVREIISNKLKGRQSPNKGKKLHYSEEAKIKLRAKNLKWYNNGEVEIRIPLKDIVDNKIPKNFVAGRINGYQNYKESIERRNAKMSQKIWMNDGKITKMVDRDKVPFYETLGWIKGRLSWKYNNIKNK